MEWPRARGHFICTITATITRIQQIDNPLLHGDFVAPIEVQNCRAAGAALYAGLRAGIESNGEIFTESDKKYMTKVLSRNKRNRLSLVNTTKW